MRLISVYDRRGSIKILYGLLKERTPEQSISHKKMPSYKKHFHFVMSHPYSAWYLIEVNNDYVGATYLTSQREIGLFIFNRFKGKGYGKQAVRLMMDRHPGRILANVNPENPARSFWEKLGGKVIQHTYEIRS